MMKKSLLAILMASVLMSGVALAELSGSAMDRMHVQVVANVGIQGSAPVDVGTAQSGTFQGNAGFNVTANVQQLDMEVTATDLYKGGDPTSLWIIPLNESAGAGIVCAFASEMGGGNGVLAYTGPGSILGLGGKKTETSRFESGVQDVFNGAVTVIVKWTMPGTQMPLGEYDGWVQLKVMAPPTI
jgi:opacity protein-like surface antigen